MYIGLCVLSDQTMKTAVPGYLENLSSFLHQLQQANRYCDVSIATQEGQFIPAHSVILLASGSPALHNIVQSGPDGRLHVVHVYLLKAESASVIQRVVESLYTGCVEVTAHNAKSLSRCYRQLQLDRFAEACDKHVTYPNAGEISDNDFPFSVNAWPGGDVTVEKVKIENHENLENENFQSQAEVGKVSNNEHVQCESETSLHDDDSVSAFQVKRKGRKIASNVNKKRKKSTENPPEAVSGKICVAKSAKNKTKMGKTSTIKTKIGKTSTIYCEREMDEIENEESVDDVGSNSSSVFAGTIDADGKDASTCQEDITVQQTFYLKNKSQIQQRRNISMKVVKTCAHCDKLKTDCKCIPANKGFKKVCSYCALRFIDHTTWYNHMQDNHALRCTNCDFAQFEMPKMAAHMYMKHKLLLDANRFPIMHCNVQVGIYLYM